MTTGLLPDTWNLFIERKLHGGFPVLNTSCLTPSLPQPAKKFRAEKCAHSRHVRLQTLNLMALEQIYFEYCAFLVEILSGSSKMILNDFRFGTVTGRFPD